MLNNSVRYSDQLNDLPTTITQFDFITGAQTGSRTYANLRKTQLDWDTQFSLPGILQGTWNVAPFVSLQTRTEATRISCARRSPNGQWVHQSKRVQTGISDCADVLRVLPRLRTFLAAASVDPAAHVVRVSRRHPT